MKSISYFLLHNLSGFLENNGLVIRFIIFYCLKPFELVIIFYSIGPNGLKLEP